MAADSFEWGLHGSIRHSSYTIKFTIIGIFKSEKSKEKVDNHVLCITYMLFGKNWLHMWESNAHTMLSWVAHTVVVGYEKYCDYGKKLHLSSPVQDFPLWGVYRWWKWSTVPETQNSTCPYLYRTSHCWGVYSWWKWSTVPETQNSTCPYLYRTPHCWGVNSW